MIITKDHNYMFVIGKYSPKGFFQENKIPIWQGIEFVRITKDIYYGKIICDGEKVTVIFPLFRKAMAWAEFVNSQPWNIRAV